MAIITIPIGSFITGWFSDMPFINTSAETIDQLIRDLWILRHQYEELLFEQDLDDLLNQLKIVYAKQ